MLWLWAYLEARSALIRSLRFRNFTSKLQRLWRGVTQGSVIYFGQPSVAYESFNNVSMNLSLQKDVPKFSFIAEKLQLEHLSSSEISRYWQVLTGVIVKKLLWAPSSLYSTHAVINYGVPIILSPNASATLISQLHVVQNATLQVGTGSHRMVPIDPLHWGTKVIPVHRSITILGQQYLAAVLALSHPSHASY